MGGVMLAWCHPRRLVICGLQANSGQAAVNAAVTPMHIPSVATVAPLGVNNVQE